MKGELKYQGKYIQVTEELIGKDLYERAYVKSAVIVFPVNEQGQILFIREFRPHETPNLRLKPVTGFLEADLTWEQNAQKELREELGLRARSLECFLHMKQQGSVIVEKYFVLARGLESDPIPNPDGDVVMETVAFSLEQMIEKSLTKEIAPVIDSLGIFWLYHLHKQGQLSFV